MSIQKTVTAHAVATLLNSAFSEIENFAKEISEIYGVHIEVNPTFHSHSLEVIERVCNMVMRAKFSTVQHLNIRSRNRKSYLILFRSIYFTIAREYGYTVDKASKHIGFDHSTGSHSINLLNKINKADYDPLKKHIAEKSYTAVLNELNQLNLNHGS